MPATPLPPATSSQVQAWSEYELNAYNVCLLFEHQLAAAQSVRFVRLLGYLLLCAPNRSVRSDVAKCIHSRNNQSDLTDIGNFFERYVIVAFKKYKGPTPIPSSHSSRSSFEDTKGLVISEIQEAPKNHASAKEQALIRDNYRCVVTGVLQMDAPPDILAASDPTLFHARTQCAHIIPEATFLGVGADETDNSKLANSASVLAILRRFHYDISTFNGPKVHSLTNVLTMEYNIHDGFDRLELYFEATKVQNRSKVKAYKKYPLYGHDEVTFMTPDATKLPLPSPEFLALHAACCQVAHLCGSAEYIDKVYRDAEGMGVLANDGASDDLLRYKLLPLENSTTAVRG